MADHDLTEAFDFIDRVRDIETIEALVAEFQKLIDRYGFQAYCVGNATAPKLAVEDRVWAATWPKGWTTVWQENNFAAIDPVVYQLLAAQIPFRWQDVKRKAPRDGVKVMNTAGEFKLNDGIGIPITSPNGDRIGVTVSGEKFDMSSRQQSCLHLAAIYFQSRLEILRAKMPPSRKRGKDEPTVRELDCLKWAAFGKTDWEISQILSISHETVHSHLKSALKKLKSINRTQAVATAIVNRMITL